MTIQKSISYPIIGNRFGVGQGGVLEGVRRRLAGAGSLPAPAVDVAAAEGRDEERARREPDI